MTPRERVFIYIVSTSTLENLTRVRGSSQFIMPSSSYSRMPKNDTLIEDNLLAGILNKNKPIVEFIRYVRRGYWQ